MSAQPITDEDAVAAADKEMEERANRAKQLLSQRYVGLKRAQVSLLRFALTHYFKNERGRFCSFGSVGH